MKKFVLRLILFLLPLSIVIVPIVGLIINKEIFIDCEKIARDNHKYIFGLAYADVGRQFKFVNLRERNRFHVVAIGSSRVMQFRTNMFKQSFYNAGGVVQDIGEFKYFLESIPKNKIPDILILGLDQWMFNLNYREGYQKNNKVLDWSDLSPINRNLAGKVKSFVEDYHAGKIKKHPVQNSYELIGVNAKSEMNGFRNDGSYSYASTVSKLMNGDSLVNDYKFKNTIDRVRRGCCRFERGAKVDTLAIHELRELLTYCRQLNIDVVAILPPIATSIVTEIGKTGQHDYFDSIYSSVEALFKLNGFEIYDFTRADFVDGSNDREMIDGFHGGEILYQRILISMLEKGSGLNGVADIRQLKTDLDLIKNRFVVYDY